MTVNNVRYVFFVVVIMTHESAHHVRSSIERPAKGGKSYGKQVIRQTSEAWTLIFELYFVAVLCSLAKFIILSAQYWLAHKKTSRNG